jgi:hypothetical protein
LALARAQLRLRHSPSHCGNAGCIAFAKDIGPALNLRDAEKQVTLGGS